MMQSAEKRILPLHALNQEAFTPYGLLLESDAPGYVSLFAQPGAEGWQAAMNTVTERVAVSLHRHADTYECFVPLHPWIVLLVAPPGIPEEVAAYRLTSPVVVAPHVWHHLLIYGEIRQGQVFICENARVTGEAITLRRPIVLSTNVEG